MYVCFLNFSSRLPIAEPLTSELIDTPVFYNLAPRPIKYRVSVPIPTYIPIPQTYQDSSCMFSSSVYSPSPSQPREDNNNNNNNNNNNLSIFSELNKAFFEIVFVVVLVKNGLETTCSFITLY